MYKPYSNYSPMIKTQQYIYVYILYVYVLYCIIPHGHGMFIVFAESFMVSLVLTRHSVLDVASVDLHNCQIVLANNLRDSEKRLLWTNDRPQRSLFRVALRSDSAPPAQ